MENDERHLVFARLRAELDWTQAEAGEWFGVNGQTYRRWEKGKTTPSETAYRLAALTADMKSLDVNVDA